MKLHFLATFFIGRRGVIFPDGRLFNTRYTEETHSKNSISRTFCRQAKRVVGRISVISCKLFPPPPTPLDNLRNKFADGKLGQAANFVSSFTLNKCSL